jgi:hypothetical protein
MKTRFSGPADWQAGQVRDSRLNRLQRQHLWPKGLITVSTQLAHKAEPSSPQFKQSAGANHPITASKTLML